MTDAVLLGLAAFALGLGVHVAAWRLVRPVKHLTALAAAFGPACLGLPTAALWAGAGPFEAAAAALLASACAAAYIQTYPAAQARSPTLVIVGLLAESAGGLSEAELRRALSSTPLVGARVSDLVDAGWLVREGRGLRLGPPGRRLVGLFSRYRAFLGLEAGRG